jgi:uncharacterized protein
MEIIFKNWDWYISGPLIGLFVPMLYIVGNKMFGISSSFEHVCSLLLPKSKTNIINYDKKSNSWKFYFVIGITIGALISVYVLSADKPQFLPDVYYTYGGYIQLFIGGILIGFGTRYANGCTSGHAITGISLLQFSSLKSTIAFFAGGVVYTFIVVYLF